MRPLAHSARPQKGIAAQPYAEHIGSVFAAANAKAGRAASYSPSYGALLRTAVTLAGLFHDLGKLDLANQKVLAGTRREKLPLNHWDAGVAYLLGGADTDVARQLAAILVYAHHQGLPSMPEEEQRGDDCLRDCKKQSDGRPFRRLTDERLPEYMAVHTTALPAAPVKSPDAVTSALPQLLIRLALSCLVDADHADTARHYGNPAADHDPPLRPEERLVALDSYVRELAATRADQRAALRNEVYAACRRAETAPCLIECDSPVGSGKTTAVMAHLLQAAQQKCLRRVFVVLPFTNIIDQSVETYRKAVTLPGERPEETVAAHHHRVEYEDLASRQFSFLWHSPVVVTTAVQFFESLAGRHPATLRKLHQVAGSAIFLDESHACLPASLWPQAWDWLTQLANHWGCHVVFGSGSLNRLWKLKEFVPKPVELPQLVPQEVRSRAGVSEENRIAYRVRQEPLEAEQLIDWLPELVGPRLLIVNTVQTAAALARHLAQLRGRSRVEHLSTALTPRDRSRTLRRIKDRLMNESDTDWTLVATSCIEAGVDVSFRTGLRERASLSSLIQLGGRVNRSGEYGCADVWDFQLRPVGLVRENPGYRDSARILAGLFREGKIGPQFCTEALRREIQLSGRAELNRELRKAEAVYDFPTVEERFRVIDQPTVTAVIGRALQELLESGRDVDWRHLQMESVQIYASKAALFGLRDFHYFPGVKGWVLDYDGFLGYMAGVLPLADAELTAFIV